MLKGKNNEEFIEHILHVSEDKKLREKLITNSKQLAQKHDLENVGKRLRTIYEHLYNDELTELLDNEEFMKDNISY